MATTSPFAKYNQATLLAAAQKLIAGSGKQAANPYKNLTAQQIIDNAAWNPTYTTALQGAIAQLPAAAPVAPVVAKQNTTVTTTTPNTGPQPISAAAVAQANQTLKTANAAGFTTVADYNNALNLAQNAGFGSDLNAYNAYVAKTNAAINPAIKPAVAATTGADSIKPPTPAGAYVPPSTVAPVAPVAPVVPAKLTVAQQEAADEAARQAKIEAARQADILARQQRAQQEAADEAARQAKIEAANVADLKTKPEYQASIQKVIDSGQPVTQAAILAQHDTDVAAATKAAADKAQADAVLAKKTDEYNNLSQTAKSQSQLDDIVAKAKAEGVTINSGYLDRATQAVQQMDARATSDALAQQKKTVDTDNFLNNLPQPGSAEFAQKSNQGSIITGPNGTAFMPIPANAATGTPGKWLISDNGGASYYNAGAKPDTAVSGYEASQQFRQTQTQNFDLQNAQAAAARAAQADAAAHANDFTWDDLGKIVGVVGIAALGVAAIGAIGEGALATEAASTAGGMAANGATAGEITSTLTAGGVAPEAAASIANTATGIATGTVDAGAVASAGGVTPEMIATANASADPIATLTQSAGWTPSAATTAATTAEATTGAVAPLTELNAAETAELMKNIDPNMISSLAPTSAGTAGGTAGSILEGTSLNPITNVLTNVGITNPIVNGALTGAATGAGINALTGKPITGNSLLMGALGGGVAGGIGSVLPDFGGGTFGSALAGAATNVGATIAVNAVTGQPITVSNLATAALTGGVVGAGIQIATDGAGNNTYQYEDGSSMTTNPRGTPVAATDSTGATVPVAAVDSRTGQPKQLAPVEDRSIPVKPDTQATVDVNNMTQEQLNQTLSQNNPYMTASEPTQVAGPYTPAQEAQYKQLVAEGRTPAEATDIVESGQDTGPAVPVSITGAAGTAEAPSYAIDAQRTPNTQLATQAEIDAGSARFNEAANAWEVTPTPTPAAVAVPPVQTTPAPVAPPVSVPIETPVTTAPVATETTPAPVAPPAPVQTTAPEQPVVQPPLTPVQNANLTPSEPIPEVRAPEQPAPAPAPETNTPTAPVTPEPVYPPVYVPPVDLTPKTPTYGPITPLDWGNVGHVNAPGLNPGFITNVPRYYNNPSPVAAQYYWGQHPYQAGQTFNRGLYNTLPVAPATPFGLQQMYNPQTQTIQNLLQGVQQASAVAPYNIPRAPAI